MARKRAENRERSLGYPGVVKPVFTKESKPLGKRKRSLGYLGNVTPVLTLRVEQSPVVPVLIDCLGNPPLPSCAFEPAGMSTSLDHLAWAYFPPPRLCGSS
ncbi:hypothetical protein TNCV_3916341 [Trichonephila clavipes]|nr:hypothetical protein TNCV_3916341 [Trichonephila clavipes]